VDARGVIYFTRLPWNGWLVQPAGHRWRRAPQHLVAPRVVASAAGGPGSRTQMQQAVGSLFLGNETALTSARAKRVTTHTAAKFHHDRTLAGGGLATLAAGDYVATWRTRNITSRCGDVDGGIQLLGLWAG